MMALPIAFSLSCGDRLTGSVELTEDMTCAGDGLTIGGNDVIIDCNGHKLTGTGAGTGITIEDYSEIAVTRCTISNFDTGIQTGVTTGSDGSGISNNKISDCGTGIKIIHSSTSAISDNEIKGSSLYGIYADSSNNNQFYSNTITDCQGAGIYIISSNNNYIYDNYLDNTMNAYDKGDNDWSIPKKSKKNIVDGPNQGGNFWSNFGLEGQGCIDKNYDGFCDATVSVQGGSNIDRLPLKKDFVAAPQQNATINRTMTNGSGGAGGGGGGGGGGFFGGAGENADNSTNHNETQPTNNSANIPGSANEQERLKTDEKQELTKNDIIIYILIIAAAAITFFSYMWYKGKKK